VFVFFPKVLLFLFLQTSDPLWTCEEITITAKLPSGKSDHCMRHDFGSLINTQE